MTEFLPGFEPPPAAAVKAKPAERNAALIAAGVHPATKRQLADNGKTCGDCGNLWRKGAGNGAWLKCRVVDKAHNDGPDMTKRWPACTAFIPTTPEKGQP